jgi:glutamate-ammonia-ligase adenylyltransferase
MALTRARVLAGDDAFGAEVSRALVSILTCARDARTVSREVAAMRELIAQEKGDKDPWDLKLARGGLTDLDFIAQALVLAHAIRHPTLVGCSTEQTFAQAASAALLDASDSRVLIEAHTLFNALFQWQRLTIEGSFDVANVPPAIVKRLAVVAGLPTPQVLLRHLTETQRQVAEIYRRVIDAKSSRAVSAARG